MKLEWFNHNGILGRLAGWLRNPNPGHFRTSLVYFNESHLSSVLVRVLNKMTIKGNIVWTRLAGSFVGCSRKNRTLCMWTVFQEFEANVCDLIN